MMSAYAVALAKAPSELDAMGNPYHNGTHALGVLNRTFLLAIYLHSSCTEEEVDDLGIAALYHDAGHAGITVRQRSLRDIPCKDIGNERYAVLLMRRDMGSLLPEDRLHRIEGMIMATTFGQTPHPHPPSTRLEKVIALADVGGFMEGIDAWMTESFLVLEETPVDERQADFAAFQEKRLGFLKGYVQAKLDAVRPLLNGPGRATLQMLLTAVIEEVEDPCFSRFRPQYERVMAAGRA